MTYRFDGSDYQPERDNSRLTGQILRIYEFMSDKKWHTLHEIAENTGDAEASISAQLRNLRKDRFGKFNVQREYIKAGLYKYKVTKDQE
tara:strand:- start:912 stop:1178 length:267 start_codon:yes stop_codon:yes gene_type:complete